MNCEINHTKESFSLDNLGELREIIHTFDENNKLEISKNFKTLLDKGVSIESQDKYNDIKFFMEFFSLPKLPDYNKIIFDTSTAVYQIGYNFSMRLEGSKYIIYPSSQYKNAWMLNPSQLGYIESGIFYSEVNIFNRDNIADNNQFNLNLDRKNENNCLLLKSQNEDLKNINTQLLEEKDLITQKNQKLIEEVKALKENAQSIDASDNQKNNNQTDTEMIEDNIPNNQEYIVQSGDTLWDLVKKNYGLSSNRDIANCVNKLVKFNIENNNPGELSTDNTPDGIFGDKIFINQKILFAGELTFSDQTFNLKAEK